MKLQSFMFDMILSELEDAVGEENVSTRQIDKLTHGVDYFWLPRMWADCGEELPQADVIVSPENTQQVSAVLKIEITTKSLLLSGRWSRIPRRRSAHDRRNFADKADEQGTGVQSAIHVYEGAGRSHLAALEWYANQRGHSTMHFPGSVNCSTLGGFLAHRGIGVLSTKYGKIDDMCLSMEVVLPNGEIINTLPVPKHAAGPDLNQIHRFRRDVGSNYRSEHTDL